MPGLERGVATVTASTAAARPVGAYQRVMYWGQLASSSARAASAGFRKLSPRPPNRPLTITTAKALPTATIQSGAVAGRLRPSIRPVTAAERSPTRIFCRAAICHRYSAHTADSVETASTISALKPKKPMAATAQGISAISTLRISVCVD